MKLSKQRKLKKLKKGTVSEATRKMLTKLMLKHNFGLSANETKTEDNLNVFYKQGLM